MIHLLEVQKRRIKEMLDDGLAEQIVRATDPDTVGDMSSHTEEEKLAWMETGPIAKKWLAGEPISDLELILVYLVQLECKASAMEQRIEMLSGMLKLVKVLEELRLDSSNRPEGDKDPHWS